jgi:calcineurin-like phosphoesterase family protein
MATYLIGNCQFGRATIIKQNKRPFDNVQEMNEEMIQRWNSVVTDEDDVIHLGNFAWDPSTTEEVLMQLNGRRILMVPAEFDSAILDMQGKQALPTNAQIINRIFEQPQLNATFAYWPLMEWPQKSKGHFLYYGFYSPKYKPDHKKKMINMACEFWNYTPQNIHSLIRLFEDEDFNS